MSLISVIVPVYKVENYLTQCVRSLTAQTHRDLEIILVDDGSPDGSGALCDRLAEEDERIKVIHRPNGGLSAARNSGLDAAAGEYAAFIDSDDWVEPDMLETLLTLTEKTGADVALCGWRNEYEDGTPSDEKLPGDRLYSRKAVLERLCEPDAACFVIACNRLCRRSIFTDLRFPEGKLHEDEFTAHEIYGRAGSVVTANKAFYHYRRRGGSITTVFSGPGHLDGAEGTYRRYLYLRKDYPELLPKAFRAFLSAYTVAVRDFEPKDERGLARLREIQAMAKELLAAEGGRGVSPKERLIIRQPLLWKKLYAWKGRLNGRA